MNEKGAVTSQEGLYRTARNGKLRDDRCDRKVAVCGYECCRYDGIALEEKEKSGGKGRAEPMLGRT